LYRVDPGKGRVCISQRSESQRGLSHRSDASRAVSRYGKQEREGRAPGERTPLAEQGGITQGRRRRLIKQRAPATRRKRGSGRQKKKKEGDERPGSQKRGGVRVRTITRAPREEARLWKGGKESSTDLDVADYQKGRDQTRGRLPQPRGRT